MKLPIGDANDQAQHSKKIDLQDSPVSVFELKDRNGSRSYYAEPMPGVLLFSTYLERMQEMLKRMDRKCSPRALPKHLSEWCQLNAESRLWAIWHRPVDGDTAPRLDPKPVGVVFCIHPEEEDLAVFRFLTRPDDPIGIHTQSRLLESVGARIKEIEPGVVEVQSTWRSLIRKPSRVIGSCGISRQILGIK